MTATRSRAEEVASQCLRSVLAPLPDGASIEGSSDFQWFQSALERVIPALLAERFPFWHYESLDAFRFAVARKLRSDEAEFIGLCLLITEQAWTPLHLRLGISPHSDKIKWMECKLGESGNDNLGLLTTAYGSVREDKLLDSIMKRLGSIDWAYTVTRGSPGEAAK